MLDREDIRDIRLKTGGSEVETLSGARERESDASIDAPLKTMDGSVVGTPAYMAPEQANGLIADVDHLSDIYSLGSMLYQMLAGKAPYMSKGKQTTPRAVLSELGQGPPPAVTKINPAAPTELVAICEKAMARRREDRYQTSLSLADDLQAYLDHRVVAAYESGPLAAAKKWMLRNRLWRWAVPSLGAVTAVSLLAFAQSRRSEKIAVEAMAQAQTSTGEALKAREQAEDLVRFTLRRIYSELQSVGKLDVLEQVLTKVDAYLSSLPIESLERPETLFLQSLTRHRSALIDRARGNTEACLTSMREAVAIRERYAAASTDADASSYLASSYDSLGTLLRESNRLEESEATFRKALPIYDNILAEYPDDGNLLNNKANFSNNIGSLEEAQKDYASARNAFQEAVTLREKILAKSPDRGLVRFGKAVAKSNLCRALTKLGLIDEALTQSRAAVQEMREVLASDATNALYMTGMALVLRSTVELHHALGEFDHVETSCHEAIGFLEKVLASNPGHVRNQARLALFRRFHAEATGAFESAVVGTVSSLEQLVKNNPSNTVLVEEQVDASLAAAGILSKESPARSLSILTKTHSLCAQQLAALDEESTSATYRWRISSAACSKLAGRICKQIGDQAESQRHFTEAEETYASLAARLAATEQIELAELRFWLTDDAEALKTALQEIDPRFHKRQIIMAAFTR